MTTGKTRVLAFGARVVEESRAAGKLGTALNYEKSLSSFSTFLSEDITFREVTEQLLVDYENWLMKRGVMRNSSSFYMRNLRSIFNKAAKTGEAVSGNPFRGVYTGIDRTGKRAVDEGLVVRMMKMDLRRSAALALARDLFVFSYCARGMAFVDVAFLRKSDIRNGVISYVRRKTGQRMTIRMEACMELIISRYRIRTSLSPYVFPVISSVNPETSYVQYRTALNYHNRKLKRLAEMLGEKGSLSTYTARHTWATAARNHNVPLSVISAGMGHTSERTTQIYLASLDNSVIDQANSMILGKLNFTGRCARFRKNV